MNVTVTGASGFIGTLLIQRLLAAGHAVHALGRRRAAALPRSVQFSAWPSIETGPPPESLQDADAFVHLIGEPVDQRWTARARKRIRDSRIHSTRSLVNALATLSRRPQVLVCASGIGYYGSRGGEILTEASPPGSDFVARLAVEWEQAAQEAEALGIRVVRLRIGMVLGHGGALPKMLPPFRLGLGGRLGSGSQWMSWIHAADLIHLILFALENTALRGAVNATAPNPVTNVEFTRQLAAALHKRVFLPVPAIALRLALGQMADLVLTGQRVTPAAAQAGGFRFEYPDLASALANLLAAST